MILESIDLTRGRRIEQSANSAVPQKIDDSSTRRRLKKGEIPHKSNDDTTFITIPTITATAIDNLYINVNWSTDNLLTWSTITDELTNTVSNRIYSFTNTYYTESNITWTVPTTLVDYDYGTNTFTSRNKWKILDSDEVSSMRSRIRNDPFIVNEIIEDGHDLIYRMESANKNVSDHTPRLSYLYNDDPIDKRLQQSINSIDPEDDLWLHMDRIIHRMNASIEDIDERELFNFDRHNSVVTDIISKLKKLAPFIKRIYVTNGGRSFDSTELKYDLVLAKEHYDHALNATN